MKKDRIIGVPKIKRKLTFTLKSLDYQDTCEFRTAELSDNKAMIEFKRDICEFYEPRGEEFINDLRFKIVSKEFIVEGR